MPAIRHDIAGTISPERGVQPASSRGGKISNAVSRIENARDTIGANVTFVMGQGNLMF